ncbi:MAG TPA: RNA methyltransferase [Pirellulales bacterium]|jgi:TrmH family RNA methyltransferase|nr:RNA methyltransferase [Pirellulales bacterium]
MSDCSSAALIQKTLARVRALAHPRTRRVEGCFWIEGVRSFVQACDAKLAVDTVVFSPILLKSPLVEKLVRRQAAAGAARVRVSPEQFRTICTTPRASGIGAIVRQTWMPLAQADPSHGLCWLIVEAIRSPGNLGTILRTADACSVGGIIFVGPQCDPFDPTVLRASMGGICHLPLVRTTHEELGRWAQRHPVSFVGLSPDAECPWTETPITGPLGLVIGEEREGLSSRLRTLCHTLVSLPMAGHADSLNVGVATGVMLYEMVRRRPPQGRCRMRNAES